MTDRDNTIRCAQHGETAATFLCGHLARNAGLGFHSSPEDADDPRPDAWCGWCQELMTAAGGWTDEAAEEAGIVALCEGCYDAARRRNVASEPLPSVVPYTCAGCGAVHHELPLDFGTDAPFPYTEMTPEERAARATLSEDTCVIDGEEHYVRACIEVPLVDAPSRWSWGVWVSLSAASFATYTACSGSDEGMAEDALFGWLCTRLPLYPDTALLKTRVHLRRAGARPYVELEPTDHPLAVEQRVGITVARARELAALLGHGPG